jgi:hypothetical protein
MPRWGSIICRDRYGEYWYTDPVRGIQLPDGSWYTGLKPWSVMRADSTIDMVEHTHPSGMYDPTGTNNGTEAGDNNSDYKMFVIRADDTIWFFPPQLHKAIYYGVINDGHVETKFTTIGTTGEIDLDADPYGIAANQGTSPSDADYSWIKYGVAIALISTAVSTVVFLIAIGAIGVASGGSGPPPMIDTPPCTGPFCFFPRL